MHFVQIRQYIYFVDNFNANAAKASKFDRIIKMTDYFGSKLKVTWLRPFHDVAWRSREFVSSNTFESMAEDRMQIEELLRWHCRLMLPHKCAELFCRTQVHQCWQNVQSNERLPLLSRTFKELWMYWTVRNRNQEANVNINMPEVQGPCDTSIGQGFYPDSLY